jgi:hypothetical protein
MEKMTETKARFIRENPRYVFKQEVVATEYLKWLEDLARKQLAYNDALQLVSNRISDEEIKRYRKEGRLSGATKREPFYKLIAQKFDENYDDTDFDILYDC